MLRSFVLFSLVCLTAAIASRPAQAQEGDQPAAFPAPTDIEPGLRAIDELSSYFQDAEVEAAQYLAQPSLAVPSESPSAESPRPVRRSSRSEYVRLARVPNMLGDSLSIVGQLRAGDPAVGPFQGDLPAGIGRSVKIGENNKGLPMDRVYFTYNGFKNALTTQAGTQTVDANIDRYTMGGEKTFWDGLGFLDVRMPFIGGFSGGDPGGNQGTGVTAGNVGDLGLILKGLLYADDSLSIAAGLGMTLPTGSDTQVQVTGAPLRLENDAVHLLPYGGFVFAPGDLWFFQSYVQVDFAASGFQVVQPGAAGRPVLTEQNLLYIDMTVGRWLYQNDYARYMQGIAGLFELHYTTTMQDADSVTIQVPGALGTLGNAFNRLDFLNATAGLQFQIGPLANLRVCCVVPLKNRPSDRQFDSEVFVSFNRNF